MKGDGIASILNELFISDPSMADARVMAKKKTTGTALCIFARRVWEPSRERKPGRRFSIRKFSFLPICLLLYVCYSQVFD